MALSLHDIKIIEYRNKILTRLNSRLKNFGNKKNYYQIRLSQIDTAYPDLKGKGIIVLKGVSK